MSGPRRQPRVTRSHRLLAALGALGCLAVLIVAATLTPASEDHGTHEQMGLPACGWVVAFDKPCPTCGMTTAFTYAGHADIASAFRAQPAGAALAILTAGVFWGCAHVAAFGSSLGRLLGGVWTPRTIVAGAAVLGLAWVFKLATWGG